MRPAGLLEQGESDGEAIVFWPDGDVFSAVGMPVPPFSFRRYRVHSRAHDSGARPRPITLRERTGRRRRRQGAPGMRLRADGAPPGRWEPPVDVGDVRGGARGVVMVPSSTLWWYGKGGSCLPSENAPVGRHSLSGTL
jgi:hypothetical protein